MSTKSFVFKIAFEEWEFEQIHRLNYKTFVEEIPQHLRNPHQTLVDKFHYENTYLICLRGQRLAGMLAIRDKRPFSLDGKLENFETYLPPHHLMCELRLLAVEKDYRNTRIFQGIMLMLAQYVESYGYDIAVISGTVTQLKLYKQLGFVPFGPLVGTTQAQFQPMYLTGEAFRALKEKSKAFSHTGALLQPIRQPISFLAQSQSPKS